MVFIILCDGWLAGLLGCCLGGWLWGKVASDPFAADTKRLTTKSDYSSKIKAFVKQLAYARLILSCNSSSVTFWLSNPYFSVAIRSLCCLRAKMKKGTDFTDASLLKYVCSILKMCCPLPLTPVNRVQCNKQHQERSRYLQQSTIEVQERSS